MSNKTEQNQDLVFLFENFIKPGCVLKEKEVVPGFKVKLKALNTGELVMAEAIANSEKIPVDIVTKIRAASILSRAIVSINGVDIDIDGSTQEETTSRRSVLYTQLLNTPAIVVQRTYEFYISVVEEQNQRYTNAGQNLEDFQNF